MWSLLHGMPLPPSLSSSNISSPNLLSLNSKTTSFQGRLTSPPQVDQMPPLLPQGTPLSPLKQFCGQLKSLCFLLVSLAVCSGKEGLILLIFVPQYLLQI